MAFVVQPTKVALRGCTINGVDVTQHVTKICAYESMCKPYLTSTIDINDNTNVINEMKLRGGEEVSYVIDGGLGKLYEQTQYISKIDEAGDPANFRNMLYTLSTASVSYFNDRASLVQRADLNIPATAAAAAIHAQFVGTDAPLNILSASLGLISMTQAGGLVTSSKKPFKAIQDILDRCSYGGFKTGSSVYFRNYHEYVIGPLEQIFATMTSQDTFYQKQTWGSRYEDTFEAYNAIIRATSNAQEKQRGGINNIAEASKGMLTLFDEKMGKEVLDQVGQAAASVGAAMAGGAAVFGNGSMMGGIPNILQMNTRRNQPATEQQLNKVAENMFRALVKDSVNYYVKVPIQSGLNVTVGRGFTANLLPPVGDLNKGSQTIGGLMLAADLCHECIFNQTTCQGTTNLRGVQISYNV